MRRALGMSGKTCMACTSGEEGVHKHSSGDLWRGQVTIRVPDSSRAPFQAIFFTIAYC